MLSALTTGTTWPPSRFARSTVGLPDDDASELGMIRVIDESEEDYLFPTRYFAPIELTEELERLLAIPVEAVA